MEGTWCYNSGKSWYTVYSEGGVLHFWQEFSDGRELGGELRAPRGPPSIWTQEGDLSNGSRIRLRLDGDRLISIYRRASASDWQPPVSAERWAGDAGEPAAGSGAALRTAAGAGAGAADRALLGLLQPPPLASSVLTEHIRGAVLDAFWTDGGAEAPERPLSAAASSRQLALAAVPRAHRRRCCLFGRLATPLPVVGSISKEALAEHRRERREAARAPDPKSTIVPLPATRLGMRLVHPVSYSEEQMLRLFVGDPRNMAYNLSHSVRSPVAGGARLAARAHLLVVSRHEVLRSAFQQEDPAHPTRTVSRHLPGGVRMLVAATEDDAQRLQLMDRAAPHQLGVTGLRCSVAVSHADGCHSLGVNMHHILSDADGMGLYLNEVMQAQTLLAAGISEEEVLANLPRLPVSFVDFAYWQKSLEAQGLLDGDLSYWYKEVVSSTPPVVLDIPIDKPRPRMWMAVGASHRCLYDNELLTPLAEVTGRATPMAVTCTNFAIVLSRLSGTPVLDVAIPFALRNMPALMNLIGNFLNMMPVRMRHDPSEPYSSTLERIATSNINVQKYSLSQFIQLVEGTRKHFPMADPSRNPIYATMVDLVPNEAGDPSTALSGVLDVFLFVNTRQGVIWSIDAVYNTTILEEQTVRTMLLQMPAIARHAVRCAREPIPRSLACCEEAQPSASSRIDVASLTLRVGLLPRVVPVHSGFEQPGAPVEYFGLRRARRLKRQSCLELAADYPPGTLSSVKPPLPPAPAAAAAPARRSPLPAASPTTVAVAPAKASVPQQLPAQSAAPRPAPRMRFSEVLQKRSAAANPAAERARNLEVAVKRAETKRFSDLIPLDGDWPPAVVQHDPYEESDRQLLQRGRRHRSGGASRLE